ncbi:cytochrome b/b6 domain-containing protein [Varunaivibrio sulfuroxidans]|uniref:Cytochrome b n=1 Tax=Varunaivibrio sulfuroxidans TaxID=1773489 RepID=A0A4R3JG14_9PROT|nr:cytochrome b/b6 domain-containing protein [Varunaivibrio sulfuroxidans]TCS63640.1 cytochrome b [Varunaivibrio sulfuroxidans]WES30220.1 cytochrome b/b6 domain-containing protein [Varunaivibrio sulfuroxidans]
MTTHHQRRIKVWDLPVRLFHWTLVASVAIGFITGYIAPEWWMGVHIWAGYITVVLVVFRLVWGIYGSEFSRIETFTFSPREIWAHMRELVFLRPSHYVGHNPSGALMVFTLIFILAGISLSGLTLLGGEENQGALAGVVGYGAGDIARTVHNVLVYTLLGLVVLHIAGVVLEIRLTGEDLVRAMITGWKALPAGVIPPKARAPRIGAAATVLGAFVLAGGGALWGLSKIPPSGLSKLAANSAYQGNCADCHQLYHPSLLPASSWRALMGNLGNHFGEDASLAPADQVEITRYLSANSADAWDTEAANRFRKVNPRHPWQITATPYWVWKHKNIPPAVFARKSIGAKGHCAACHRDDASGRFDDQKINIPKE